MSEEDLDHAEFELGYKYELIDGRLYVTPEPGFGENRLERWLVRKLDEYSIDHPDVINYVSNKTRVYVKSRPEATIPEPDVAAYAGIDLDRDFDSVDWCDLSPILVCEILRTDPDKDLVRNVDLYFEVPMIREYWVVDARGWSERPTLIQRRRYCKRWLVREYPYGSVFSTRLLPGFTLVVDPRK